MTYVAPFTYISLFSGVGMLDLGFEAGLEHLGIASRCLCHVEGDVYAAGVLAARMQEGSLAETPIHSDVRTFDGRELRGYVDAVVGGFPCQDLSVAGKRAGIDGKRSGLWSHFARIVGDVRPRFVFVENVPMLLANVPMRRVLGDLSALGFDAEWSCVSAASVGAPHKRERVFILAYAGREHLNLQQWPQRVHELAGGERRLADAIRNGARREEPRGRRDPVANAPSPGREESFQPRSQQTPEKNGGGLDGGPERLLGQLGHAIGTGLEEWRCEPGDTRQELATVERGRGQLADTEQQRHKGSLATAGTAPDMRRRPAESGGELANAEREPIGTQCQHEKRERETGSTDHRPVPGISGPIFPPGPSDRESWQRILETEPWRAPAVESGIRVLVDGTPVVLDEARSDQLRCGGNGCVPLAVAAAVVTLMRRIKEHQIT